MKISRRRYSCCPNAEAALIKVRELAERAMLRPAPRILRCIPVQTRVVLKPIPAWKREYIRITEAFANKLGIGN